MAGSSASAGQVALDPSHDSATSHSPAAARHSVEASASAQEAWVEHVAEVSQYSLLGRANSWYVGANIPGKARVFMPYLGFAPYVEKCDEVAAKGYEGFVLR